MSYSSSHGVGFLHERIQSGPMSQSDCRQRSSMLKQDGIKKNLWTMPGPLGGITQRRPLRVRWRFLPIKLMAHQTCNINKITGMSFRPTGFFHPLRNAPAATKLHCSSGQLTHLGNRNRTVALLDQHAVDSLMSELHRQR